MHLSHKLINNPEVTRLVSTNSPVTSAMDTSSCFFFLCIKGFHFLCFFFSSFIEI